MEHLFTNSNNEEFIFVFDRGVLVEAYSKGHNLFGAITPAGLGQYCVDWDGWHSPMRAIPCQGRDGWPFWLVTETDFDTMVDREAFLEGDGK